MLAFAVAFSPRISASGSRLLTTVFVFLSWLLSVRMLYLLKRVRAKPTKKKIAALCAIGSLALHGLLGALLVSTSKVAAERPSILGRLIIDSVEGDDITFHFQVENGKVLIRNVEVSFTTTVI